MYSYYFNLQRKRFERAVQEFGLAPWLAYSLIVLIFSFFVYLLYIKTSFPAAILTISGLFYPIKFSQEKRTDFLKSLFADHFIKLRLLENLLVSFPVLVALFIKLEFFYLGALMILLIILSFWRGKSFSSKSYNKLFSKYPFEFTSNFRLTAPFFILSYFLCGMGLYVGNYNLSAFSLALIFFMTMIFYSKQEAKYFIWIFDKSVDEFIVHKFISGLKYTLMISLPIIISICWFAPQHWYIVALIVICGLVNLLNIIIIRYGIYPKEYGLFDSLAIVFCVLMPPFALISIPLYYKKLSSSIKPLLS